MSTRTAALDRLPAAANADATTLLRSVQVALDQGLAQQAEPILVATTQRYPLDHRLWQFLGLVRRELQNSEGAHEAFNAAARLAPSDPLIAHSQARTALEAGFPAVPLFNRARQLAPGDGSVALGRIAALYAEGQGELACDQLARLLDDNPGWIDGHVAFSRFTAQSRPGAAIDATLRRAIALHPQAGALWQALIQTWMSARDYSHTLQIVTEARAAFGPDPELDRIEAACLSELGEAEAAQRLLDRLPAPTDGENACWFIRNAIRLGRMDQARSLAEASYGGQGERALWPYRALIWRLNGDPRWEWLEGRPEMIRTFDIRSELGSMDELAELLRALHTGNGQPLDQSVRGGSQTDGNLLVRGDPVIRRLRSALLDAVHQYVAALPLPEPGHPLLVANRDDIRIAGSWSVRLSGAGFHADHVHWQGWISSAFYVVVPEPDPLEPESGWLAFGECRDVLPDFRAFRTVEPKPGILALFPSTLWHGTRPFGNGERMTVAYDIARPREL